MPRTDGLLSAQQPSTQPAQESLLPKSKPGFSQLNNPQLSQQRRAFSLNLIVSVTSLTINISEKIGGQPAFHHWYHLLGTPYNFTLPIYVVSGLRMCDDFSDTVAPIIRVTVSNDSKGDISSIGGAKIVPSFCTTPFTFGIKS